MIAVIQRVLQASVSIDGTLHSQIGRGMLVLLGIGQADTADEVARLSRKITALRIFSDPAGKMNLDLRAVGGNVLLVSQFTLLANTAKGNRPSFTDAARPEVARPLYDLMIAQLSTALGNPIQTGQFGADMQVALVNDGPVTIVFNTMNDKQ
jgi:D-aminoacyl-tRNA deacylase